MIGAKDDEKIVFQKSSFVNKNKQQRRFFMDNPSDFKSKIKKWPVFKWNVEKREKKDIEDFYNYLERMLKVSEKRHKRILKEIDDKENNDIKRVQERLECVKILNALDAHQFADAPKEFPDERWKSHLRERENIEKAAEKISKKVSKRKPKSYRDSHWTDIKTKEDQEIDKLLEVKPLPDKPIQISQQPPSIEQAENKTKPKEIPIYKQIANEIRNNIKAKAKQAIEKQEAELVKLKQEAERAAAETKELIYPVDKTTGVPLATPTEASCDIRKLKQWINDFKGKMQWGSLKTLCKKSRDAIIWYLRIGFKGAIPCYAQDTRVCNKKKKKWETKPAKSPRVAGWQNPDYTGHTEQEIIEYHKCNPYTLWGLPCSQGLSVVDFDTYNPEFKEVSQRIYKKVQDKTKVLIISLKGGIHCPIEGEFEKNSTSKIAPGIDIRTKGGYMITYKPPIEGDYQPEDVEDFLKLLLTKKEFLKIVKEVKSTSKTSVAKSNPPKLTSTKTNKQEDTWTEGTRNNNLYGQLKDATKAGDRQGYDEGIEKAKRSGLEDDEIQATAQSVIDEVGHPPKKGSKIDNVVPIKKPPQPTAQPVKEDDPALYEKHKIDKKTKLVDIMHKALDKYGLILKHRCNGIGGQLKIGKSKAIMALLFSYIKNEDPKAKLGILSSENDLENILPQLRLKDIEDDNKVIIASNRELMRIRGIKEQSEKIRKFKDRVTEFMDIHGINVLLIDPAPRVWMNWNSEQEVTDLSESLNDTCREKKRTIIIVRNDGKEKKYDQVHSQKGSSGLEDTLRMLIRAIEIHKKSALGKRIAEVFKKKLEKEGKDKKKTNTSKKALVLTSQFANSNLDPVALIFIIDKVLYKDHGINVEIWAAFPMFTDRDEEDQIHLLKHEIDHIEILCSPASGRPIQTQIRKLLMKYKVMEIGEIKEHLPHITQQQINDTISKNPKLFISKKKIITLAE